MGCTSSTQTAAQDTTRPIQQEKSNGAATTGAAKENRTVEEDSVTIPDQTQAEVAQPTTSESPVEPSVVAAPKSTEFGDKVPADAPGHAAEAEASAPKAEAEAKALAPKAEAETSAPKAEAEAEAEAKAQAPKAEAEAEAPAPKAEAEAEAPAPKAEAEAKAPAPKAQAPIDAQPAEGPADGASAPDSSEPAPDTQGDKAGNTTEIEEAAASLPKPEAASE